MRTASHHPTLTLVVACTIAVLFFFLGITFPSAHFWGRYLLPVVLVFLWGRRRDIFIVTGLGVVLLIPEFWMESTSLTHFLASHLLPVAILCGVAWLLARQRQLQEQTARHEQELDEQVKLRTAALAAREEQLAKIFRGNPGGIAIIRQSDSCYLEANDAYLAMVGFTRDQLIGHTSLELGIVPLERRAQMRAAFQAQGHLYGQNVQLTNARGEAIDTYYSSEAIEYAGEPCYLALMVDITELRQLEETTYRLAAIVDSSTDAIVSTDMQGRIVGWNHSAEQIYGSSAAQAIGRPINELLPTGRAADEASIVARVSRGDTVSFSDLNWTRADGTKVDLSIILSPVKDKSGAVIGIATVAHDVSERKRAEAALAASELLLRDANAVLEQRVAERTADLQAALADVQAANRLKDEFMAMISHELRTPLTGILTLTELLEEHVGGMLTDRQAAYVQGIGRSGARLLYVVNGILGYIHLLSGKVQFNAERCALRYLLDTCATAEQHNAAAKSQAIVVAVEPPDLAITGDATALVEVLKRLLDNAIRFTPVGGRIGLEAHPNAGPGAKPGAVDLVVWDTGVGIPAEQIEHIFKPFVQADGSLARSQEGLGLGLAYVDQLVRLMRGTLRLESTPGEGSRFTITLPA